MKEEESSFRGWRRVKLFKKNTQFLGTQLVNEKKYRYYKRHQHICENSEQKMAWAEQHIRVEQNSNIVEQFSPSELPRGDRKRLPTPRMPAASDVS